MSSQPPKTSTRSANRLLAALPAEDWARISPRTEHVNIQLGEVIYESGEQLDYVYFPTDSIISLLYVMETTARQPE